MTFAVTSKGFVKEKIVTFTMNNVAPDIEVTFTTKLREAKIFGSKGKVSSFLRTHGLEGFAFSPKEQEPIKDKYNVVKRRISLIDANPDLVNEWVVERAVMINESDIAFLNDATHGTLYSKDEAIKVCTDRNIEMLKELQRKVYGV